MFKVLILVSLATHACGFGNASQGAFHLGAVPEFRNVARHRPCKPRPVCSHLVDGRIDLNGLDRAEGSSALARTSAESSPVLIFLRAPTFVSQIVVHLVHRGHPGVGVNRLLMVSLWQKPSGTADLGPPTKRWKWDPERAIASGGFRVVVPVQRVALAVAVAWEGHGQGAQGAGHPHNFHNSSGISGSFRGSHGHGRGSDGNVSAHSDPKSPNNDIWISEVLVLNEQNQSDLGDLDHNTSQKRSLGLKLQNTETSESRDQKALNANLNALNAQVQGSDPASERKLRTAAKTVSILQEPELPKNEFTTSVQMHVQVDESMKETGDFVPSEPSEADTKSEMELNVQKTFSYGTYGTEKSVASVNIVKMKNPSPIADETDPEMPNASKAAFHSEDPMTIAFLSPSSSWPKRSDLGTSLKTCFAALLAAVILALKINKVFSFFQCCKSFRANDWESYDYDQLPQLPQLPAEPWWERSEREETERNDRNDRNDGEREAFRPETETDKKRGERGGERGERATPERSAASNPGADNFASAQASGQRSTSLTTTSTATSETQRLRSLSPNVSDRTMSEPEQEPQHEPQSEPSEADGTDVRHHSTDSTTNVSEAEDDGFFRGEKPSRLSSSKTSSWSFSTSEKSDVQRNDQESEHMMLLYASPLCFRDGRGMMPLPQIPVEKEWETVLGAYNEASHILSRTSSAAPGVSISAQTLTAGSLQRAITTWHPGVLHLSSHGVKDCLVLEDGGGTAHFFSCSMLRAMLELAGSSTRLVLLNCCSLSTMGNEFVEAGVPHVVCCSCDLKDSASQIFLRVFYSNLFQGTSVQRAFNEAIVALRSHSERSAQAASHHFRLLPEGNPGHEKILFFPKAMDMDMDSESSDVQGRRGFARRRRPRRTKACPQVQATLCWRQLPSLPEDFLGREVDVWSVLQQLNQRRAVVVCSAPGEDFGVGKTCILDSVHRAFTLLGHTCVAVQLRSLSQAGSWAGDWIEKANAAVRLAIHECRGATGPSSRRRRMQGPLRTGFHPLSDPLTTACLLDDLIEEMLTLADLCDARFEWTNSGHRILLLLDECDHLVQQQQFQDALACILQRCSSYSVLLSTHQPMVPAGASKFKVVQHRLQGLLPRDAARLLLRRAQRPLRWGEVQRSIEDPSSLVILNKENESEVLDAVSSQPRVAALKGNPRRLIELANDLDSLTSKDV